MRLKLNELSLYKDVPDELRSGFTHLFLDIMWYGVLNGSAISFITIYFARIGGSGTQIGLLGALPAVVTLAFALPAGSWLQQGNTNKKTVWASVLHRLFYLLWIPIPYLFANSVQIELLLLITFVMTIPGTILQVGFNEMFAVAVPVSYRGYVAGVRNALFAIMSIVISLICGQLLVRVAFPVNYQIVFGIGFVGAMLSSLHLWLLDRKQKDKANQDIVDDQFEKADKRLLIKIRSLITFTRFQWPNINENRHFYLVMILLFVFHTAQYLSIPVFPVYWVNNMHLTDNIISIGNGVFFFTVFIGSTQISNLSTKYGNKLLIGIGAMMMAFYPGIMAFGHGEVTFFIASLLGGLAWSLVGGLLFNYILEKIPEVNRPSYLAIYNFAFYAAILIGSISGPQIGRILTLPVALILFAILRLGAGALILWKG